MRRQGASTKGLQKRLGELQLGRVRDPRITARIDYPLRTMLGALVVAMVTKARSLRAVEQRTEQMTRHGGSPVGLTRRIADNTFSMLLRRLRRGDLMACVHRLVKAEHRRGNLAPDRLPFGAVAIDGKHVATLRWPDLCRVLGLEQDEATVAQVRDGLNEHYPMAQLCVPSEGQPHALVRTHTATLISAPAAVCIHQRPIAGHSNEIGSMAPLVKELHAAYGKTRLFDVVTTDAGNTSVAAASQLIAHRLDYFCRFKSERPELSAEAERRLGRRPPSRAAAIQTDVQNGAVVTYHLWRCDLSSCGWLDWTHARQLIRVRRTVEHKLCGTKTVGHRYWITSLARDRLGPQQTLALSRAHWRCEDENHWKALHSAWRGQKTSGLVSAPAGRACGDGLACHGASDLGRGAAIEQTGLQRGDTELGPGGRTLPAAALRHGAFD